MNSEDMPYVLVTPARNEEAFIELTIQSVLAQTIRPVKWSIVSDGSTDRTDEIVGSYAAKYDWIDLVRMGERTERDFAGKVGAFNVGYAQCRDLRHAVVASLDADITFDPGYFGFLLEKLEADPGLGLVGTPFAEDGHTYDYRFSSTDHVSGACQVFRRKCFEEIGGYVPVKGGGIDVIAVLSARSKGWRTRTFVEKTCIHHRPMGSANHARKWAANFQLGERQYRLGFHPLWQIFRAIYQLSKPPRVTGGLAIFSGYFWALLRRVERPLSRDLVEFQRRDQMRRLRGFFLRRHEDGVRGDVARIATEIGHPPKA